MSEEETGLCLDTAEESILKVRRFENENGTSCKFYEIVVLLIDTEEYPWVVETTYGSMKGNRKPRTKRQKCISPYVAETVVDLHVKERLQHGYTEVPGV